MIIRMKRSKEITSALKTRNRKESQANERAAHERLIYVSRSELDASISFLLKKYADTFKRLAE
ncbi:MAG: hypothetical protein IJ268_10990 [Proteobacteria bacterium]|nr:hypothetical protein [Pseudomonadota bacterium]